MYLYGDCSLPRKIPEDPLVYFTKLIPSLKKFVHSSQLARCSSNTSAGWRSQGERNRSANYVLNQPSINAQHAQDGSGKALALRKKIKRSSECSHGGFMGHISPGTATKWADFLGHLHELN